MLSGIVEIDELILGGTFSNMKPSKKNIQTEWRLGIIKRAFHGTHHHFSKKYLQRYIDEASFRLNEGNYKIDTIDRIANLCIATKGKRINSILNFKNKKTDKIYGLCLQQR